MQCDSEVQQLKGSGRVDKVRYEERSDVTAATRHFASLKLLSDGAGRVGKESGFQCPGVRVAVTTFGDGEGRAGQDGQMQGSERWKERDLWEETT